MHRVIILGFPLLFLLTSWQPEDFNGICRDVLDGDTVVVAGKRIRLLGVDAPELSQSSMDGKPIGLWAQQFLSDQILGVKVRVTHKGRDRYGRVLGEVWLGERNMALELLSKGLAISNYFKPDFRYRSLEYKARLQRKGIFKTSGFIHPYYFRKKKSHP